MNNLLRTLPVNLLVAACTLLIAHANVARAGQASGAAQKPAPAAAENRLESLDKCIAATRTVRFGALLKSAPATFAEQGPFKAVPYVSLQSGTLQLKLFGDPLTPAGVEMALPEDAAAAALKAECVVYLQKTLTHFLDRAIVRRLDLKQDWVMREDLTFEVKPVDPAKGNGLWRIAVYDEQLLKRARVSAAEFAQAIGQREKAFRLSIQEVVTSPGTGGATQTGASNVEGTAWQGNETLTGYDRLKFVFSDGRRAAMHDTDGVNPGTYEHKGNSVTLSFYNGKVVYNGIIRGTTITGTATNGRDNWIWSVKQLGVNSGRPVAAAPGAVGADDPNDSTIFTGSIGTGLRAPDRVVHPEILAQMTRKYAIDADALKRMSNVRLRELGERMLSELAEIDYDKWVKLPAAKRFEVMMGLFAEQRNISVDDAKQLYIIQEKMHYGFTLTPAESRFYAKIQKLEGK